MFLKFPFQMFWYHICFLKTTWLLWVFFTKDFKVVEDFQFPFSANLKNSNSHEKNKLIIPYNFSKFRKCSNLKKDHELCMLFATLVVVLLLLSSFVTCMLLQALPWYCCWSTMSYILYYILHSYCYHPWWLVELQLPLLLLVFYCCNSIVIVIDVTLLCCGCHPW
jgi:hypothetical protein